MSIVFAHRSHTMQFLVANLLHATCHQARPVSTMVTIEGDGAAIWVWGKGLEKLLDLGIVNVQNGHIHTA